MERSEARRLARKSVRWNLPVLLIWSTAAFFVTVRFGLTLGLLAFGAIYAMMIVSAIHVIRQWTAALTTMDQVHFTAEPDALAIDRDGRFVRRSWNGLHQRIDNGDVVFLHFNDANDPIVVPTGRAGDDFLNEIRRHDLVPKQVRSEPVNHRRAFLMLVAIVLVLAGLFFWSATDDRCDLRVMGDGAVTVAGDSGLRICT